MRLLKVCLKPACELQGMKLSDRHLGAPKTTVLGTSRPGAACTAIGRATIRTSGDLGTDLNFGRQRDDVVEESSAFLATEGISER